MRFAHLHVHTQYSVLDGAAPIKQLFTKAKAHGQPALAITDHGNMFGVKEFLDTAKKFPEVKPIVGCEVYMAPEGRLLRKNKEEATTCHLILLAKNIQGYHNLIKLVSQAYIDGMYYKPRIDHELLEQYHEGLMCSSACLAGELPRQILAGKMDEAEKILLWYKQLFGPDYYVELQRHPTLLSNVHAQKCYELQKTIEPHLIALARKHDIKVVATNDVHFVNYEDADAHDRLICVATAEDVADENRKFRYTQQEYLKSTEEMQDLFNDVPEAISNTLELVEKVEVYEIDHKPILPHFPIPEAFADSNAYLRHLAYKGAERLYPQMSQEVRDRMDFELATIAHMGFPDYFLIVRDFIQAARNMGVWVGPGRGSAAGSVVAYCLEITLVDPLKYGLLFERFLNPDRISLPDIDIDFADDGRGKVLQYVENKYGKDHVSHVITFGTMAAKSAIKDVARVQRLPLSESDRLAKLIPDRLPDKNGKTQKVTIDNALPYVPDLQAALNSDDPLVSSTIAYAQKLEGSVRNIGVHACAIIIGPETLTKHIPLSTAKDKETGQDMLVSQYEGSLIEQVGMLKMDFLGLKTLSILKDAVTNIQAHHQHTIDLNTLPLDDTPTYQLFSRGDTVGVFQFESDGMRKWLRELQPSCIEDLIAMTALYRPGPMDYIPDFIARKHGTKQIAYDLPEMEQYLKETYGVTVYQEQVMLLSQVLAGFTKGQADTLRKAMGKKQIETMEKLQKQFLEGGKERGHDEKTLLKIWADWKSFAQYAFNKSHATCYSMLSYQCGYLKAHYPAEFMAAVLSKNRDNIEEITKFMDECKRMNINVLGPDVNESVHEFTVTHDGNIRFAMAGIKGVGYGAVESIIQDRAQRGRFTDVYDFMERVNTNACNRKVVESLIYAGAFDSFTDIKRHQYFLPCNKDGSFLDALLRYGAVIQEERAQAVNSLFGQGNASLAPPQRPAAPSLVLESTVDLLKKEKETVGIYLSAHPLDMFRFEIKRFTTSTIQQAVDALAQAQSLEVLKPQQLVLAGIVTQTHNALSQKTGQPWGSVTIEDYSGTIAFRFYGKDYEKHLPYLVNGNALLVHVMLQERPLMGKNKDKLVTGPKEKELRVTAMSLLSNAKERIKGITLTLPVTLITPAFRQELVNVVAANPGKVTLHLAFIDSLHHLMVPMVSRSHMVALTPAFLDWIALQNIDYSLQ